MTSQKSCCALAQDSHFFFTENIVNEIVYLDMLKPYAPSQIEDERLIFSRWVSPPHYANVGCDLFDEKCSQCWIGRDG